MTDSIFRFFPVLLRRVGYIHMFVVPWLISLIGDILVYIFAPNISCDFLCCIVLVVLMLFLPVQIHVYSVLYGLHMLIVDYNFLFSAISWNIINKYKNLSFYPPALVVESAYQCEMLRWKLKIFVSPLFFPFIQIFIHKSQLTSCVKNGQYFFSPNSN